MNDRLLSSLKSGEEQPKEERKEGGGMKKLVYLIAGALIYFILATVVIIAIIDTRLKVLRKDLDTKASVSSVKTLSDTLHAGDSTNAQALADDQVQQKNENGKILARLSIVEADNQVLRAANTALHDTLNVFKQEYATFEKATNDSLAKHRQHMTTNFEQQDRKINDLAEQFNANKIYVASRLAFHDRYLEKMRKHVNNPLIDFPVLSFFFYLDKPSGDPAIDSSSVPAASQ